MTITRVELSNFTVFDSLEMEPSPGINALVGANGTGKTHLLKVCYAACDVSRTEEPFSVKLAKVFLPSGHPSERLGRLINRSSGAKTGTIKIFRGDSRLDVSLPSYVAATIDWSSSPVSSVYIPAKEMLANAPGFRSLYAAREIHFEEVYADILDRAYLPPLRGPAHGWRKCLLDTLESVIGGKVTVRNEEFFLSDKEGDLEFALLAEGMSKLGLLWLLIRNGTLSSGSVLFWDEPETNLNPKLHGVAVEVLLELQRRGVQVFLATHEHVLLSELDLQAGERDKVAFHTLFRSKETGQITCRTVGNFHNIRPNLIGEAFDSLYDRDVKRALEGFI